LDLFVFGSGQIADVVGAYFNETGRFRRISYVVDEEFLGTPAAVDGTIMTWSEALREARVDTDFWFTAISFKLRNQARRRAAHRIKEAGYRLASYIHPTATVWEGFHLSENTIIMENNVLQRKVSLGANSIVWSNNHIGHHTAIGSNTFISSEVCISGNCSIGDGCFFGVNSTLYDGIEIGNEAIIGAGAVVASRVADRAVVEGVRST